MVSGLNNAIEAWLEVAAELVGESGVAQKDKLVGPPISSTEGNKLGNSTSSKEFSISRASKIGLGANCDDVLTVEQTPRAQSQLQDGNQARVERVQSV
eukprot:m.74829 g.74829  ORF g.74829 m.74829 type:complete len:98 (-) comp14384_c0_seq1:166-459(-)